MKTRFIEATSQEFNWGKFAVSYFTEDEWAIRSAVDQKLLLQGRGWSHRHVLVLDLQTGEGALFNLNPLGLASSDLNKHKVWVCPLFEPFLQWLYAQPDLDALPDVVDLPHAVLSTHGYRRDPSMLPPDVPTPSPRAKKRT